MSNNEVNNSDSEISPSKVPQLTRLPEYDDDGDEIAAGAWGILSKRFPNTAHVLCELNEVINHSQITLSQFRNTVSSFQIDGSNENIPVKKCKKLSDCKLFTRDASVSTIETQTTIEGANRGNIFKAPDCRKSIKNACVSTNIDCLPEALSTQSIEDTDDTDDDDDDDDIDEDDNDEGGYGKKETLYSSFDSLFYNCGSYDLRYSRANAKASIDAVGDQKRVTAKSGLFRIEKTHTFVKDDSVNCIAADKRIPAAITRHEVTITSGESSTSSKEDNTGTLSPTITTKDVVFKPVEGRISTPVDDRLITAIREPPTSPQTESIHPSRETSRLSTPINEQQNSLLNNPSIRPRVLRVSSIPISQNLAKSIYHKYFISLLTQTFLLQYRFFAISVSPKKQSRIPRKSPRKDT
ncbi:Protein of unknown function [Cotesia congregata]|uniref:Uncharacterized protein n=1 Tax=Cotesia congregata TaxID=51543 RepID=A0A8J2HTN1_COTCN|nr:Protein of unknown function [Cotesia congregata]